MWAVLFLLISMQQATATAATEEQECPLGCECYIAMVNWIADCSNAFFTDIPVEEFGQNVYILNINNNEITEIPEFPHNVNLRRLHMANNFLTSLTRSPFSRLKSLLAADFSGNRIKTVDVDTFRDCELLFKLKFHGNPLQVKDGPFISTSDLLYLDLSSCNLEQLSPKFFSDTINLISVDLSGNPLGVIESGIFDPLTSLEDLKLKKCKIFTIYEKAFSKLRNLRILKLSENYLTAVQWPAILRNLGHLSYLDLTKSLIRKLPRNAFKKNKRLRSVILAKNALDSSYLVHTLGNNLKHLHSLDLSNCGLRSPLPITAFAVAIRIRSLKFSSNYLSGHNLLDVLSWLPNLRHLYIRNCGLSSLPKNTFEHTRALEVLDISHNELTDSQIHVMSSVEELQELDMSYTNVSDLSPNTFSKMNHLRYLKLSGNRLTNLKRGLFKNLDHLQKLDLDNCGLTDTPHEHTFKADIYQNFQELNMSGNHLCMSDLEPFLPYQLRKVKILDFSKCNLTVISKNAFSTTPEVRSLDLSGNKFDFNLSTVPFLNNLPNIEKLDLRNCNLTYLSPKIFDRSPNLITLKLTGNEWKCDCYIVDIWEWAFIKHAYFKFLGGFSHDHEDIIRGIDGSMEKLTCQNVTTIPSLKTPSGTKQETLEVIMPWAKYFQESECPSTPRMVWRKYGRFMELKNKYD